MSTALPGFVRRLTPRDPGEEHRAASPLELLTDLCFVVAISQAAALLHHEVSHGSAGHGLESFGLSFFGIFWAWLNFTWFGSAYDNDDVVYRLITILQILGSLVYAAGISDTFEHDSFTLAVAGYVIMRIALVFQWLRAARSDPERRSICLRYAAGITVVQVLWVLFLLVPPALAVPGFLLLVLCEVSVPLFAERRQQTPWHPHHIAERYGLFFIIVLGETILSSTVAIQQARSGEHPTWAVGYVVVGGILVVFSVWWLYFARDTGRLLAVQHSEHPWESYIFGFGHFVIFASGAAIGAGLAVRVDYWTHEGHVSALGSAALVTVPTATLLSAMWLILLRHERPLAPTLVPFGAAVLVILGGTFSPLPEVLAGVACAVLLAVEVRTAAVTAGAHGRAGSAPSSS
jgi:low temperature requirement protein LtrA